MLRRLIWVVALILMAAATPSLAQTTPQVVLTWRAATYAPDFYNGKALPIPGSKIVVAIDLISGGRPTDLSRKTIYWYLGDKFVAGGVGLTRLALTVPDTVISAMQVRAALPDDNIAKTITIPVSEPRAVIEPPSADRKVHSASFSLKAWPYFFNVGEGRQLNFQWKLGGQSPSTYGDPEKLDVKVTEGTPKGSSFPVTLRISNPAKGFEFGRGEISFIFDP